MPQSMVSQRDTTERLNCLTDKMPDFGLTAPKEIYDMTIQKWNNPILQFLESLKVPKVSKDDHMAGMLSEKI